MKQAEGRAPASCLHTQAPPKGWSRERKNSGACGQVGVESREEAGRPQERS